MTKRTYRGDLPKPDRNGCWRPYVGQRENGQPARFTVGNRRDTSEGEAHRRLDSIRDLYERQCHAFKLDFWHADVLAAAQQIANGIPASVDWREGRGGYTTRTSVEVFSKAGVDRISKKLPNGEILDFRNGEELARLVNATGLPPSDPKAYHDVVRFISETVRREVQAAVAEIKEAATKQYGPMVASRVSDDPTQSELRSFHDALKGYRQHIDKIGDRDGNFQLRPHAQRCQDRARWLQDKHEDFPIFQLDLTRMEELVTYWRNRPVTRYGTRCSNDHAKHMIDELFSFFRWLDNQPDWNWQMPRGATTIKRKTVTLEQDYLERRVRRVSANTYSADQLAIIAKRLDKFGKMILGLAVNCGMGPGEFGRVEVEDVFFDCPHPEAKLLGIDASASWVMFDRRKTGEYGEWRLWPVVGELLKWGVERSKSMGVKRLAVKNNSTNWYADSAKNAAI